MAKKETGITYEQIIRDVKAGDVKPVYCLMGEEDYYIDRLSDYIQGQLLQDFERDFNLDVVYGADASANQIVQMARSYPAMAERRVVVVREMQVLKPGEHEALATYVQNPTPTTVLILCYKHGTLDRRKSLAKAIQDKGVLFESRRLYDRELPGFVSSYFRRHQVEVEPAASQILCEYVGSDLNRLASEMDKLLIAVPQGQSRVTSAMVEELTGISKDYNSFELQNALAAKDVLKANRIVNYFNSNPRNFALPATLSSLFGFFSDVMLSYYSPVKTEDGVAQWLGKSVWQIRQAILPARQNYSGVKVMNIIGEIRRVDGLSKGVDGCRTAPGDLLKELVFYILH